MSSTCYIRSYKRLGLAIGVASTKSLKSYCLINIFFANFPDLPCDVRHQRRVVLRPCVPHLPLEHESRAETRYFPQNGELIFFVTRFPFFRDEIDIEYIAT